MSLIISDIDLDKKIGTITFNNDAKRNSLSREFVGAVIDELRDFAEQKMRVAILRVHPGTKVWSAGHYVPELSPKGVDPLLPHDPLCRLVREIKSAPFPVIASVAGGIFGGANEVVAACDIVIAAYTATFKFTPARMGVPYSKSGLLTMINALGVRAAKEMAFTAKQFSAAWAEKHGLVNRVVHEGVLDREVLSEAENIAKLAPLAISAMKRTIATWAGDETSWSSADFYRQDAYSSDDYEEGKRAFNEKREPVFTGK